jgi:formylglycine-generating enzyme required for sulfatase activity
MPKIAISYRRADTDVMAGRIRDRLAQHYGEDAIFMDIDSIPFGKDFRVHIFEAVVQSDLLLVIVGQRWLGARRGANRRIDSETDFVRLEVETALGKAVPIIPVLAGSARMPQPAQLPESLKDFAFLNAAPVDTGRDFHQHVERLIRSIDQTLSDRCVTSPATLDSRDEVATPASGGRRPGNTAAPERPIARELIPLGEDSGLAIGPLTLRTAGTVGDLHRSDLVVFSDAPFAPELVVVPAGEFLMGSAEEEEGRFDQEGPRHRVSIGQRLAIGRYPVTFAEYDRFCEAKQREKPGDQGWGRERRPVINVSWRDAQAYIMWLSQETGRAHRLPSEAEWEYACRARTTTRYSFGDAITTREANYADSGLGRTSEVGAYPANPWGLHDMHGNVCEWVEDDWHESYRGAPTDGSAWKEAKEPTDSRLCVLRGGSWGSHPRHCRSAYRVRFVTGGRVNDVGFRVARTLS